MIVASLGNSPVNPAVQASTTTKRLKRQLAFSSWWKTIGLHSCGRGGSSGAWRWRLLPCASPRFFHMKTWSTNTSTTCDIQDISLRTHEFDWWPWGVGTQATSSPCGRDGKSGASLSLFSGRGTEQLAGFWKLTTLHTTRGLYECERGCPGVASIL